MTTTEAGTLQDSTAAPRPVSGVPFRVLLRVGLRKLVDTCAGRWLIVAIVAITPLVVLGALVLASPADLTFDKLVDFTQTPQKILLPALGVLAVTSEWSARNGLATFTLNPGRRRVMLAKILATLLAGLISITCAVAAAAAGNLAGRALRGGDGSWSFGLGGLRDLLLVQLTGLLQGSAFGMLLLVSSAAIICSYVLPNLRQLLFRRSPAHLRSALGGPEHRPEGAVPAPDDQPGLGSPRRRRDRVGAAPVAAGRRPSRPQRDHLRMTDPTLNPQKEVPWLLGTALSLAPTARPAPTAQPRTGFRPPRPAGSLP
jgi:ABC-2 type transport system permease protein